MRPVNGQRQFSQEHNIIAQLRYPHSAVNSHRKVVFNPYRPQAREDKFRIYGYDLPGLQRHLVSPKHEDLSLKTGYRY
jgi:hypothetical protein